MKRIRVRPHRYGDPPYKNIPNWQDQVVDIWEEDDAPVPDKERVDQAFKRITGRDLGREERVAEWEEDGEGCRLYRDGWVVSYYCDGCSIGKVVLYDVVEEEVERTKDKEAWKDRLK